MKPNPPSTTQVPKQEEDDEDSIDKDDEDDEDEDSESSYGSEEEKKSGTDKKKKKKLFKESHFFEDNLNQMENFEKQKVTNDKDLEIEDLFGKVFGIERVLLLKKNDTLKEVIEKITLIPESKLVYVDVEQGFPKVKNMLALSDLFAFLDKK
jgi:hypothetical protein